MCPCVFPVLAADVNLVSPEGDRNKTARRRNDVTLLMSGSDLLEHIVCSSRIKSVSSSENTDRPTGSLAQGGGRKQVWCRISAPRQLTIKSQSYEIEIYLQDV